MKTKDVQNFNGVEAAHRTLDNPTISRDIPMAEVVVVFHSVNSGDFMLRDLVVVFHSVNSGDIRDASLLILDISVMDDKATCGVAPVNSVSDRVVWVEVEFFAVELWRTLHGCQGLWARSRRFWRAA